MADEKMPYFESFADFFIDACLLAAFIVASVLCILQCCGVTII